MSKENLLGLPIYKKIEMFLNLDLKQSDIQRLTGLNENLVMTLSHEKRDNKEGKYLNMSVAGGQAIADAFDKMVHQGRFPSINPNTPDGISLAQKIRYVFSLPLSYSELSKMIGISAQQVSFIKRGGSSIDNIKLTTAIRFEDIFKQYLYSDQLELILKDTKTVANRNVDNNELVDNIYKVIREYRLGNYLIIDTHDKVEHAKLYQNIKQNIQNGVTKFNIEHVDTVLNRDFELHFNFDFNIEYGEDTSHVEIINNEERVPYGISDSSVDKSKAM